MASELFENRIMFTFIQEYENAVKSLKMHNPWEVKKFLKAPWYYNASHTNLNLV